MNVTVIVWLVVGLVIFVLSFLLPKRKEELDEDTKKFAGEQIRDILNKEIAGMQSKLDDVVSGTIEESSSQTERALEKLTNEKIMAINEYSDTVIEDINNNHKEVLFLYDMLNDKHVTIRNTVTEVEKTMGEVTQTAKDIEISAREAAKEAEDSKETVKRMTDITNRAEKTAQITAQNMEMDVRHIVEDMIRGRVEETMEKTAVPMIQERVDEILEDAALLMEQQPKILIDSQTAGGDREEPAAVSDITQEDKEEEAGQTADVPVRAEEGMASETGFVEGIIKNAPQVVIEEEEEGNLSYYIVEPNGVESTASALETAENSEVTDSRETAKSISEIDMAPEEIRELERAVAMEVMLGAQMKQRQEIRNAEAPIENEADSGKADLETGTKQPEEAKEALPLWDQEGTARENNTTEKTINQETAERTQGAEENFITSERASGETQKSDFGEGRQGQESRNSNEKILALHREGMSNMAIAKELGLGVGEVKLVIDLFKGM